LFVLSLAVLAVALLPAAGLAAKGGTAGKPGGGGGGGGKPGGGGGGTIALVLLDSSDGVAHYGQRVTFDVHTTATAYPYVTLRCYQNGGLVYQLSNAMFATSLNQIFTLGPTPSWTGGAASCTADLESWSSRKVSKLASTSFAVEA
jgi:hypothetical protein